MDPITLALLAGKGLLGAYQLYKGSQVDTTAPEYKIPGAIEEATDIARARSQQTVAPGEAERQAEIARVSSEALGTAKRTAKTGAQVFGSLYRSNVRRDRALRSNQMLNRQFQQAGQAQYIEALNRKAGYQEKAFNINQLLPYQQATRTKEALISGGIQTLGAAGQDIASFNLLNQYYNQPGGGIPQFGAPI